MSVGETHLAVPMLEPSQNFDAIAELGHEAKAIVFAAIPENQPITSYQLHGIVSELLKDGNDGNAYDATQDNGSKDSDDASHGLNGHHSWNLGHSLVGYYAKRYTASGLTKSVPSGDLRGTHNYSLTEYGARIARPLAGHLLDLSEHSEQSLIEIFGPVNTTSQSGIRPCQRRIAVLDALRRSDTEAMRVTELVPFVGLKASAAGEMVAAMARAGLVTTNGAGRDFNAVSYLPTDKFEDLPIRLGSASQFYIDIIETAREYFSQFPGTPITNTEIAKKLIANGGYPMPLKDLASDVANRTNSLAVRRGALQKIPQNNGASAGSLVKLDESQIEHADHLLDIVDGLHQPDADFLEHGVEKLERILEEPEIIHYLLEKAKLASNGVKSVAEQRRELRESIIDVFLDNGHTLTSAELERQLRDDGIKISIATLRGYMRELRDNGQLKTDQHAAGYRHHLLG